MILSSILNILKALLYYFFFFLIVIKALVFGYGIYSFYPSDLRRQKRLVLVKSCNQFMTDWVAPKIIGLTYNTIGIKNLPAKPVVFMMRHESAWETVASIVALPTHTWVLKRELFLIPLFGWALKLSYPVGIDRGDKIKALKKLVILGKQRISWGISLLIFPEGTRKPPGQIGNFHSGGAFLAKQLNLPIVPVAHNAGLYWPKNSFIKKSGKIQMVIGKPIKPDRLKKMSVSAINFRIQKWMRRVQRIIEPI